MPKTTNESGALPPQITGRAKKQVKNPCRAIQYFSQIECMHGHFMKQKRTIKFDKTYFQEKYFLQFLGRPLNEHVKPQVFFPPPLCPLNLHRRLKPLKNITASKILTFNERLLTLSRCMLIGRRMLQLVLGRSDMHHTSTTEAHVADIEHGVLSNGKCPVSFFQFYFQTTVLRKQQVTF